MRATRKRAAAIIQAMEDDDSVTMIKAAQKIGLPGDVAAEWYQHGSNWKANPVMQEFYRAVRKQLMDRERKEQDRLLIQTAIVLAKTGDKAIQKILKQKGSDYSQ